ncbi:MAG: uracil-DNA glycosylase family protein [Flavobacteriales bacterium]|nr:uracil-DNA glycosylase family protein [Flavobacteriales bacterium]HPF89045.1 uracil-DNA glycosylase family protein [Flavobacteriales bacterium]
MKKLLADIRACAVCAKHLPLGPRPILAASPRSRIVIIGQAPGRLVHGSGMPWDDKSGDNLRTWLGVTKEQFYDPDLFALMPMGFCYPGKGASGDLPPRPECAPLWHAKVLGALKHARLTILIGQYAHAYYLGDRAQPTLTDTVKSFKGYLPELFPLVHPSPRNNIWQAKNPWFGERVLPELRQRVQAILTS